mgnify:CR=1 FL=1
MTIDVYGATWCGDCRQAKNTLDKLGAAYTWHNIEEEEGAADRAVAISGQMHIPVVRYDDGSFQHNIYYATHGIRTVEYGCRATQYLHPVGQERLVGIGNRMSEDAGILWMPINKHHQAGIAAT